MSYSIPKCLNAEDYLNYSSSANPTTQGQYQGYVTNQNLLMQALAAKLWQPTVEIEEDAIISSPNMPAGKSAQCVTAGTTGSAEPVWSIESDTIADGSVEWKLVEGGGGSGSGSGVPAGAILAYGGSTAPDGYLFADGSAVSRTDYADLFAVYGTTFGAGDGSTTFNLPDYTGGTFLEGDTTAGTYKSAGLPNITGSICYMWRKTAPLPTGCFSGSGQGANWGWAEASTIDQVIATLDASRSSTIYGNSTTVQPKSLTCRIIIKY